MLQLYLTLAESGEERGKLEEIYREYKSIMLGCAFSILRDEGLAEDAVHNAFLRILKNLGKIGDVKSPQTRGFVIVVTENVAKSMYTKRSRTAAAPLEEDIPDSGSVETAAEQRLTAELIAKKIAELPERYSRPMILRYLNDMSDSEISSLLSISPANVRKRLERGRKKLSTLLGGQIDG